MAKAGCYVAVASLANAIMFFVTPHTATKGVASVMQSYSF